MFSVKQKREIAEAVQEILRKTNHPELPAGEIRFKLRVEGAQDWSWAEILNNGAVTAPSVNLWNEMQAENDCPNKNIHPTKLKKENGLGWWHVWGIRHNAIVCASSEEEAIQKAIDAKKIETWEHPAAKFIGKEMPEVY